MNEAMLLLGLTSGGNVAATATGAHNGHGGHGLSGWSLELEAPREAHASSIGCESGPFGGAEQPCDFEDLELAELREAFADFEVEFAATTRTPERGGATVVAATLELDLDVALLPDTHRGVRDPEGYPSLYSAGAGTGIGGAHRHSHSHSRRSVTPEPLPTSMTRSHSYAHSHAATTPRSVSASPASAPHVSRRTSTRRTPTHRRTLAHSQSYTQLPHLPVLSQHPVLPTTWDEYECRESEDAEEDGTKGNIERFSATHHVWVFLMAATSSRSSSNSDSGGTGDEKSKRDETPAPHGGGSGDEDLGAREDGTDSDDHGDAGSGGNGSGGLGISAAVALPLLFYDHVIAPVTAVMSTKLFGQCTPGARARDGVCATSARAKHHVGDGSLDHYDDLLDDPLACSHPLRKSFSHPNLLYREPRELEETDESDGFCSDDDVEFPIDDDFEEESSSFDITPNSPVATLTDIVLIPPPDSDTVSTPPPISVTLTSPAVFTPPPNSIPTHYRLPADTHRLDQPADIAHLSLTKVGDADSKCGAFIADDDRTGESSAVVKVWNSECAGRDVGEECLHREGVYVGDAVKKETAAYRLDQLHFDGALGVPYTDLVLVPASKFPTPERASLNGSPFALCSWQRFIDNTQSSENLPSGVFPVEEVHKIAVLDIMMANLDRHSSNVLVTRRKQLVPIDHGLSMPDYRYLKQMSFEWLLWQQSKEPLSSELRQKVLGIDTDKGVAMLKKLSVPTESIVTYLLCVAFLKEGVKAGKSLYDIGDALVRDMAGDADALSKFEVLVENAKFAPFYVDLPVHQEKFVERFTFDAEKFWCGETADARAVSVNSAL